MSRFKTKQELVEDIIKERKLLEDLLDTIPKKKKLEIVTAGMSVKDFLAHRAEWGIMMTRWYEEAKAGKTPAVPTEKYKWNQLKELNADIFDRYKGISLEAITKRFNKVHDNLFKLIEKMDEKELLEKNVYDFTGKSDLATYINSATASHYRSARRHIQKWWKQQKTSLY